MINVITLGNCPNYPGMDIRRVFVINDVGDSLVYSTAAPSGVIEGTMLACNRLEALTLYDDAIEEGFEVLSDTRPHLARHLSPLPLFADNPPAVAELESLA